MPIVTTDIDTFVAKAGRIKSPSEDFIASDVDFMIRTGGEKRISNFLLWQAAYAELYFSNTLWPDYDEDDLKEAFQFFSTRERRFGMTSAQVQNKDPNNAN